MNTRARSRGGPPRKAENVTGSSGAFARAVALSLPGASEDDNSFVVRGKVFLELDDGDVAIFDGEPVRLRTISRDKTRALIEDAWRGVATARSVAAYDARPRPKTVTRAQIRRFALSLPGAVEMLSYGLPSFCVPNKKNQGFFARFGPNIGNLLPPDDADCLYIPTDPMEGEALLQQHADRFFVTPHYVGHGVLTRLSENTTADLPELKELLTESWRRKATQDLIEEFERRRAKRR